MSDEFDDAVDPVIRRREAHAEVRHARRPPVPRLIARLYLAADQPLRTKLLACLVRPLSSLGLMGVAAGAFAGLLLAGGSRAAMVASEDAARFSGEQILELARFVEQASPAALQQFARLIAASPLGAAAFSAAAVVLLLRALPGCTVTTGAGSDR
jgi:hypothetical protein